MSAQEQANEMTDLEAAREAARAPKTHRAAVDEHTGPRKAPTPGATINSGSIEKDTPFHPSPTLDERHISSLENYEEFKGYLEPAKHALSVAVTGLQAIDTAWQALRNDTSKTDQQKSMAIEPAASRTLDRINRTFVKANEDLSKAVELIEGELSKPHASGTSPASTELRGVLRAMNVEDRNAAIEQAVKNNDMTVVTAVLGAHPLTSGVDPLRHSMWSRQWNEKANPDLMARLAATKQAISHLNTAAPIALASVEKAMRAKFSQVAKVRTLSDASTAALAAIMG